VDHWEAEVAYADGTVEFVCLVPNADGLCSLTMPAGASGINALRFRSDLSAPPRESGSSADLPQVL
jgi:hypothetical protein